MTRKFEFKKTYEEIEVGNKTYKMEFNDEKMKEYQQEFTKVRDSYIKLLEVDETKMNEEEALKHFEDIKSLAKKSLNVLLGEGSFDSIYEASGHSIINVYDFVWYLAEIVKERSVENNKSKRDKYLKNKKVKK
jgi:hypothetical protein